LLRCLVHAVGSFYVFKVAKTRAAGRSELTGFADLEEVPLVTYASGENQSYLVMKSVT
jgi:hypothetical protein